LRGLEKCKCGTEKTSRAKLVFEKTTKALPKNVKREKDFAAKLYFLRKAGLKYL
jgi:hypothetical protein